MERKLDSPLEGTKWWKQSDLEELRNEVETGCPVSPRLEIKLETRLEHKIIIKLVSGKGKGKERQIRYCEECGVSWPCLVAQEAAINRGRIRRDRMVDSSAGLVSG
jgi:hypothetical protein